MEIKVMDARGMACPLPVVNTKKMTEDMQHGEQVRVLVDNEIAVQNLEKFAKQKKYHSQAKKIKEQEYEIVIEVLRQKGNEENRTLDQKEEIICQPDMRKKGLVVVLSANVMGTGDEKLGKSLMKAFVFALTKQEVLPETIVCYNTGAYLTCQEADTLEDLKSLEAEGVTILTCGTCLDFYGIKDSLAVGTVTNMYEIVEIMEKAGSLVRP